MKVYGVEFTDDELARVRSQLLGLKHFEFHDARRLIAHCQPENSPARLSSVSRAADRLLQKMRKAGEIEYSGGKWRPVNPEEAA